MKDHLQRIHFDKRNKDFDYFKMLKEKLKAQPNLNAFLKSSASADNEGGLNTSSEVGA